MKRQTQRVEKHEMRLMTIRADSRLTKEEKESQVNRIRHRRARDSRTLLNDLRGRQIERRNRDMMKMRRMGKVVADIVGELHALRPDLTPGSITYHLVAYSRDGRLTCIDVLNKAIAHAQAGLPMPWEVRV